MNKHTTIILRLSHVCLYTDMLSFVSGQLTIFNCTFARHLLFRCLCLCKILARMVTSIYKQTIVLCQTLMDFFVTQMQFE